MSLDREQSYIRRVFIRELEGTDLAWLDKVLKMDYNEVTLDEIVTGVIQGNLQLWRWDKGVLVTELDRKVLNIIYLIGSDFLKHWKEVEDVLTTYAENMELTRITCKTENKTLQKFFNKKLTRGSITYYKEI